MRPAEVLDLHGDLLDRLTHDARFREVVRLSFTSDHAATMRHHRDYLPETVERNAETITRAHVEHVRSAETYRVTADMCDLLVHLAETQVDASDTWQPRLAPTPSGIVRFDKPIMVRELRGRTMKAHWLVWGPMLAMNRSTGAERPVTLLTWYNDLADPDEVGLGSTTDPTLLDRMRPALGRWAWLGAEYLETGSEVGAHLIETDPDVAAEIRAEGDTPAEQGTHLPRYAYTLWLLLGQTIAAKTIEEPDRAGRRRAARMKIPPRVTVIQLRNRESRPAEGESHVEWQHQWIVRQHLRWQPRGPRTCPGREAGHEMGPVEADPGILVRRCRHCDATLNRITIDPYVKGPPGAPLMQTQKVYDLCQ